MRTLVWIITWIVIALWSGIAWAAHWVIGLGGQVVSSNSDILPVEPEMVEWASWLAVFGTDVGEWLVIIVWAIVAAIIFALGFIVTRLVPAAQTQHQKLSERT